MSWKILALIGFIWQFGIVQIVIKKIGAVKGSRTRKLVWQYFFATLLAFTAAIIFGQVRLNWSFAIIAMIGVANAFACYCHWRAYDISMSRTAVISNLDDVVAMGLGYAVLGEMNVLTPILLAGIILSLVSATVFARVKYRKSNDNVFSGYLIVWVLGYTLAWGVAMFSMRFFYLQGLNILTYVIAWYFGSFLGALLTRFAIMGRGEAGPPLTLNQLMKVFLLAIAIWTAIMVDYWIRTLGPITVIQPIQLVAEMSVPSIIGLILFKESRNMSRLEISLILVGLAGITLIAVGL